MPAQTRARVNISQGSTKVSKDKKTSCSHSDLSTGVNSGSLAGNDYKSLSKETKESLCVKVTKTSKQSKSEKKSKQERDGMLGFLCGKAKYLILFILIPPFLNFASLQRENAELKPEGELYDVGWGQKLFLSCSGTGPPTVVLDAPTGKSSDVWTLVVPKIAKHARVCIYDRAGIGFSDRPINKSNVNEEDTSTYNPSAHNWEYFTVEKMVDDLHKLLTSSSQQPQPFILVGAEIGALTAQFYTLLYESNVYAMVLVNPLPDELFKQADGLWAQHWFNILTPTHQTMQLLAATGLTRLGLLAGIVKPPVSGKHLSEKVINRQKYLLCYPRHLSSVVDEHYFINESFSQLRTVRRIRSFPSNISVSILTGNYHDEQMPSSLNKAWAQAQQTLISQYFPRAQHLVVNGGDRHMCYRQPESIVEAVVKMIKRWKRKM